MESILFTSVRDCPRCNLVNTFENKYCAKCSYPLVPEAFDEIKEAENSKLHSLEEQYQEEMIDFRTEVRREIDTIKSLVGLNPTLANAKSKQILENFIEPLVNQGYIDQTESDLDKRNNISYPVVTSKIRKLFDSEQSNNLLQECCILVKNPSLYPDKQYIISKIREVLKYSTQTGCNIVEKIVSHDNLEISIKRLVETYYDKVGSYFRPVTSTAKTSPAQRDGVCDEYFRNDKIASELQERSTKNLQPVESNPETCEKLFDDGKSNNFRYSCYYCNAETNNKNEYESRVVLKHPGKLCYPDRAYLEKFGLQVKGKSWEKFDS
jgi:hypothetical protein